MTPRNPDVPPAMGQINSRLGLSFFKLVERALLLLTAGLTIIAAATEV